MTLVSVRSNMLTFKDRFQAHLALEKTNFELPHQKSIPNGIDASYKKVFQTIFIIGQSSIILLKIDIFLCKGRKKIKVICIFVIKNYYRTRKSKKNNM